MAAQIIDGVKYAQRIYNTIRNNCLSAEGVDQKKTRRPKPTLAILTSDSDPASRIYVRNKLNKCQEVGISCLVASISPNNFDLAQHTLQQWADNNQVHGIIIQRPSPFEHLQYLIPSHKDVDGFAVDSEYDPCTPIGIMHLLHSTGQDLTGKHAVVVGRSDIVGNPLARMLLEADCTVTQCHSKTIDLASHTKNADILVSAVGKPNLITADMVKPGAIVIDVGINSIPDPMNPAKTMMVGDVDFALVKEVAGYITPTPGGVGPMTVAMLLRNTYEASML